MATMKWIWFESVGRCVYFDVEVIVWGIRKGVIFSSVSHRCILGGATLGCMQLGKEGFV